MSHPPRLLIISNERLAHAPVADVIAELCEAGAPAILLREESLSQEEQRALAAQVIAHAAKTKIIISDDVEFAIAINAPGIHVAPDADLENIRTQAAGVLMGVHCHSVPEVRRAAVAGADYATLSPIFETPSKPGYGPALGLGAVADAAACGIPVLALGGVNRSNARGCLAAGAYGLAIMGEIMRANDPAREMQNYRDITMGTHKNHP